MDPVSTPDMRLERMDALVRMPPAFVILTSLSFAKIAYYCQVQHESTMSFDQNKLAVLNSVSRDSASARDIASRIQIPFRDVQHSAAYLLENGLIAEMRKEASEDQKEFFITQNGCRVLACQQQQ